MLKFLQSSWMAALVGAVLFLGTTAAIMQSRTVLEARSQAPDAADAKKNPDLSWDIKNPEVDLLIAELKKEKETVAQREQQINELSARVDAERAELTQVMETVNKTQKEYEQTILRVRDEETANLKKLAKIYAAMTPEGAVVIVKQLQEDEIVKILIFMKESETAPILEAFAKAGDPEAKRVAKISERLRVAMFRPPKPAQNQ